MRPLIVRELRDAGRHIIRQYPTRKPVRRVMSPQTAAALLTILRDVVKARHGHERVAIPGYAIAGKTGTAQMVIGGGYGRARTRVVHRHRARRQAAIRHPGERSSGRSGAYYGGIVAAPAFRELARRVLWREGVLPQHSAPAVEVVGGDRRHLLRLAGRRGSRDEAMRKRL